MANPFLAEIRMFPFNFAPNGWAQCNGQIMPISQNTALFALLGTFYGGDGRSSFGLPDLRGSVAISSGKGTGLSDRTLGEQGGTAQVTLFISEMAAHSHPVFASSSQGDQPSPTNNLFAAESANTYADASAQNTQMASEMSLISGGTKPHNNLMPYLAVNFCIVLQGIFPPRS